MFLCCFHPVFQCRFADSKILRSFAKWQLRMIQAILYCILFKLLGIFCTIYILTSPDLRLLPGPLIAIADRQALIDQNEAVRFAEQGFDPVPPSSTEKEESTGRRIHLKLVFDNGTESVNGFPHIGVSTLSTHKDKQAYKHEIFILIFCKKH